MLLKTESSIKFKNRIIIINLTHKCNYDCWYCYDKHNKNNKEFISFDYIEKFFNYYVNYSDIMGVKVVLMGGEPTLHPGIQELVNYLQSLPFINIISIITNLSAPYNSYVDLLQNDKLEVIFSYHFNNFSTVNEEKAINLKRNNYNINIELMIDDKISIDLLKEKYSYLLSYGFSINKKQLYGINYSPELKSFAQSEAKRFVKFIYDTGESEVDINTVRNLNYNPFKGMKCDSFKLIWNIDSNGKIKQNCSDKLYNIFDDSVLGFFKLISSNICTLKRCNCWVEVGKYR